MQILVQKTRKIDPETRDSLVSAIKLAHVSVHVSLVAKTTQTEFAKCFSARGFLMGLSILLLSEKK